MRDSFAGAQVRPLRLQGFIGHRVEAGGTLLLRTYCPGQKSVRKVADRAERAA